MVAGDQFLAGARGAGDHDAAVGRRQFLERGAQVVHRRRGAEELAGVAALLAQHLDLAAQLGGLQSALGDQHQPVGLERLLDVVVSAALDGGHRGLDVAVAGDHHHGQVGMGALDLVEQRQPVQTAALQPDVEEDQRRAPLLDFAKRGIAVGGGARAVPFVGEDAGDQFSDVGFVVNDQNVGRHVSRLSLLQVTG